MFPAKHFLMSSLNLWLFIMPYLKETILVTGEILVINLSTQTIMPSITKITLSISLLGIIILLILTNILPYPQIKIKDVTLNHLNKKLSTSGTITKIQNHKEFQIITITQNSFSIDILLDQKINLTRNQKIQIKGRLEKYKNKLQIRTETIAGFE